ncbi:MAG: HutD family protein [Cypionkella sp.]
MIQHLTRADFKEMPWANGKGTTVEMLRVEREGRLVLRLSRAMVVENGPFSLFPGIERNLTVLSGPGFELVGAGLLLTARPLVPLAFAGDILVHAEGVTAPSEDFNVMTDSALPRPDVWVQRAGMIPSGCAALALEAGQIGEIAVALYDLVLTDEVIAHDRSVIVVRAAMT